MLLLEYHSRIVEDVVLSRITNCDQEENVDVTCADFDGVTFHIASDATNKEILRVSVSTRCYDALKKHGVEARLKSVYGDLVDTTEASYDATLKINIKKAPKTPEFARNIALLKRNVLASVFQDTFEKLDKKEKMGVIEVRYRAEEAFYLKPEGSGCVVVYSIWFRDKDDILFSKVFLNEFQDARKTIRGAPSVTFSQRDPPLELQNVRGVTGGDQQGFVSFALFPDHLAAGKRERTIDQMLIFRDYLHYHIKCSKAYLHQCMRARVGSLLQVLNRAKQPVPNEEKKKKTFAGKSFKRN